VTLRIMTYRPGPSLKNNLAGKEFEGVSSNPEKGVLQGKRGVKEHLLQERF